MPEWRRFLRREELGLIFASLLVGLAAAAVFGAYRAVSASGENAGGRLVEFAQNLVWPGVLIFGAVAVVVWAGWKANLD
ncbi:MAG: hypothetical protein Q8S13_13430 [Dehalococcoidia bacterium]|nr:hypothetical protein [Dehalococcoidia bacterium]